MLWHGGMSFHGGAIGTFVFGYWAMRRRGLSFHQGGRSHSPDHPARSFLRSDGQFHQRRALRKTIGLSPGPWSFPGRARAQASLPALRGRPGRPRSVRDSLVLQGPKKAGRGRICRLSHALCRFSHILRVLQGTGRPGRATSSALSAWGSY